MQIYTGNGKGKTTAAMGLALRAIGAGWRVYFVQFMKNYPYSELSVLKQLAPQLTLKRFGNDAFVFQKKPPSAQLLAEMQRGWQEARQAMLSDTYDLIVLDEICVSIYFKLLTTSQVLQLLDERPDHVELVLTGRYCPGALIERADLVTEMREIKHYYQKGIPARRGIES